MFIEAKLIQTMLTRDSQKVSQTTVHFKIPTFNYVVLDAVKRYKRLNE